MTPSTFYLVTTEYPGLGFGAAGDPPTVFDDAVDQYIEARDDDQPAAVWQLQPGTGDMIDVTSQAISRAHYFWRENRVEPPAWACDLMAAE